MGGRGCSSLTLANNTKPAHHHKQTLILLKIHVEMDENSLFKAQWHIFAIFRKNAIKWGYKPPFTVLKGVLHPSTKISMFCLFSPSSRGKLILFMYGCDKCNDSKSKSMIFFHWIYKSLMWNGSSSIFSLFNLKTTLKSTELIHLFAIVGIIPIV